MTFSSAAGSLHAVDSWQQRAVVLTLLCLASAATSACLHAQAKTVAEVPLDMPAPPERVVEVSDPSVPAIVSVPEEPARPEPTRPRPAPPARTEARPSEPARPEPARIDAGADTSHAEEPVRPPAAPLQTTPTQQEVEMDRRVRALLVRASTDLSRVDYRALNTDGRTQYDTAKRFVSQAEEALKVRNLVFAANLADKASALAATLAGR
jgi:hypothetical protein